ncbi:hypothetical protein TCAL_11966 [Tigriopus californicus]|uniref:Uncharacterized protein n=1 Tax=Tigriopus californicus TaxID=6832 RepID=A0A553NB25_TIGCA|nr:hypothetical protein TCAL_11966 [Tigriopus californicus]|eukprot:TCALIF_11966-PB protein Name:"Protein of unknown function" AED:0.16 eAED:0.16 QI:129/0.5/1/1/0.5/0.66/3/185/114
MTMDMNERDENESNEAQDFILSRIEAKEVQDEEDMAMKARILATRKEMDEEMEGFPPLDEPLPPDYETKYPKLVELSSHYIPGFDDPPSSADTLSQGPSSSSRGSSSSNRPPRL